MALPPLISDTVLIRIRSYSFQVIRKKKHPNLHDEPCGGLCVGRGAWTSVGPMRGLTVIVLAASVSAQFDQLPRKPKPAPLAGDVKYIRCATCEKMIAEALKQLEGLSSVSQVEDLLDKICDADADGKKGQGGEGLWMSEYDIQKKGQALQLVHQGPGHCRRECRTIAKACDSVVDKLADEDLAEYLLDATRTHTSVGTAAQRVCVKMAGVCKKSKVPLYPEGKVRKNEQFKPKDDRGDSSVDALLSSMSSTPGGLNMVSASDLDLGSDVVDEIDVLKDEV